MKILHRAVDARKRIVIRREPAVIFCKQPLDESRAAFGSHADQILPRFLGPRSAGRRHFPIANFKHGTEKVQDVRVGFGFLGRHVLVDLVGCVRIERGKGRIQAAQSRIAQGRSR